MSLTSFQLGSLPFMHLGIPLIKGKPKYHYLKSTVDRIQSKLETWKGSLLSIIGRVQLVDFTITNMIEYSFHIYASLVGLLKQLTTMIKNFIWSGDGNHKNICIVAWK